MKSISKCPDNTILKAVVLGEINEPLLDYYLDHIEGCDRCTEIIDKSSWHQFEFQNLITRSQVDRKHLKPDRESLDLDWLESLKKSYPSKDFLPANNPDNALGLPEMIGNYRLANLLGSGATSMVYQAMDMNLLREVALKILHPEFDGVPEIQESIMSEARAIASLSHENILPIFHVEKLGTNPVLVFPLLPGCTLQKALEQRKFNLRETLKIICDLCGALDFIHSRGIIHRDIKPSNIWLEKRPDGSLKPLLFDFGFAGMKQNRSGTSGYMAPEQILQQKNSPATDMFALGSLLFLMAGQDEAPDMIKNIIHQLLMEKPADRPTASQLFKALDEWLKPNQPASALAGTGDPAHHTDPLPSKRQSSLKDIIKSLESKRSISPLKVGGLILPFVLVAMALLIYFSFNHRDTSLDNGSIKNPVAIDSQAPVATALDLIPAHVFSGTNHLLNSISGNGKVFASHTHKNNLALYFLGDSEKKTDVALPFHPTLFALNQQGNLLAASNYMGNIAIVKIPTGKVLFAIQDKEYIQVENFGWGGKHSDVLLFSQNNKIFQLKPESQDKYPDVVSEIQDTKVFKNALKCDNITTHAGTDFFLANISVANSLQRILMVYNLAENKTVKITSAAPVLERSNKAISSLGWVDNELIFATHNRNLFEYSLAPLNSPQDLIMPVVKSSELPSAPDDLIWLDTNHFIALTDVGGTTPSLYLYNRENQVSFKKFETNGEWVKQLKKLDGNSFAAFCESGKVLTYTLSKSLDK
jgi:serine/threonine protein kinase